MRSPSDVDTRLEALYRDYAPRLVAIVKSQANCSCEEAEDGCQLAWSVLTRRPDVLDGPAPRAWLVTVAVRACRAERARSPLPVEHLPDTTSAPPLDDLLEARAALRLVAALRPVRRRVFERRLAGLSYAEIAAEHWLTYTNVNRQISRSRAELRALA